MAYEVFPGDIVALDLLFRNDYNVVMSTSWRMGLRVSPNEAWQQSDWFTVDVEAGAEQSLQLSMTIGDYPELTLLDVMLWEQELGYVWGPSDLNPYFEVGGVEVFQIGEEPVTGEIVILSVVPGVF